MKLLLFFVLVLGLALATEAGREPASPLGKILPSVGGTALDGTPVRFPEDLRGNPALLLVAYRRGTQADIDRWMAWAKASTPGLTFYEVPAIAGVVWRPMAGWIDQGMRGGVPKESWSRVVTLYADAPALKDFLGDTGGYRTHAVLLDAQGKVVWFDAQGYSEGGAAALAAALAALEKRG